MCSHKYQHVQDNQRKSLQSKSIPCIFLGYPDNYRAWKCWNPIVRCIIISGDVIFDKHAFPGNSQAPATDLFPSSPLNSNSPPSHSNLTPGFPPFDALDSDGSDNEEELTITPYHILRLHSPPFAILHSSHQASTLFTPPMTCCIILLLPLSTPSTLELLSFTLSLSFSRRQ